MGLFIPCAKSHAETGLHEETLTTAKIPFDSLILCVIEFARYFVQVDSPGLSGGATT